MKVTKCWHHLLYAGVISFLARRKCEKSKKSIKIFNIERENLLNDLRNLNEIFRNDQLIIMLKVTKNGVSLSLSRKHIFGETTWGGGWMGSQTDPPAFSVVKVKVKVKV